jgi:hypothetical protein
MCGGSSLTVATAHRRSNYERRCQILALQQPAARREADLGEGSAFLMPTICAKSPFVACGAASKDLYIRSPCKAERRGLWDPGPLGCCYSARPTVLEAPPSPGLPITHQHRKPNGDLNQTDERL